MSWSCSGIVPSALGPILSRRLPFLPQHQLNFVAIPYWSCRLDPGYSTKNYGRSRYPFATERLASLRILPAPSQRFLNRKGGHPVCNKQPPCDPLVLLDCNNKPKSASSRDGNSHAGSTSQNKGALAGSPAPVHRSATANLPRILYWDKAWKSDQNDPWLWLCWPIKAVSWDFLRNVTEWISCHVKRKLVFCPVRGRTEVQATFFCFLPQLS